PKWSSVAWLQSLEDDGERQQQGKRRIEQAERAVAFIPLRCVVVFSVDEQGDAARLFGDDHAALGGAQQKASAKPAPLHAAIDGEATQPIDGNLVAREAARCDGWRAREFDRGQAQRVEAENARGRLAR